MAINCDICGKSVKAPQNLRIHKYMKHGNGAGPAGASAPAAPVAVLAAPEQAELATLRDFKAQADAELAQLRELRDGWQVAVATPENFARLEASLGYADLEQPVKAEVPEKTPEQLAKDAQRARLQLIGAALLEKRQKRNMGMKPYDALIDGGQGGRTTIRAASIQEALDHAMDWAKKGDWTFALERPRPTPPLSEDYVNVQVIAGNGEHLEGAFLPWDIPEPALLEARQDSRLYNCYTIYRAGLPQHNISLCTMSKPNPDGVIVMTEQEYESGLRVETRGDGKHWDVVTGRGMAVLYPAEQMNYDDPIINRYVRREQK